MIVDMSKAYIVSLHKDTQPLLNALADLGVMHLKPVEPEKAVADEETLTAISELEHTVIILSALKKSKEKPADITPLQAAERTTNIQRHIVDLDNKLTGIYKKLEAEKIWGNVTNSQFRQLIDLGIDVKFYLVYPDEISKVKADCVCPLDIMQGKHQLVAVAVRDEELELPEGAHELPRPHHDRPELQAQVKAITSQLEKYSIALSSLANMLNEIKTSLAEYQEKATFISAQNSGLSDKDLFALQGWVPNDGLDSLHDELKKRNIEAAVHIQPVTEDEVPPTLIRYPKWAKPIKTLFDLLGTTPGYREFDLSPFFMVAMPIFSAMLIGDAGYGLIFTAIALIFKKKIAAKASPLAFQLLLIFGVTTFLWGTITANFFGITPAELSGIPKLQNIMKTIGFMWNSNATASRNLIMKVSFIFGTIHLVLAHLRQAIAFAPNVKFISEIGWCSFLFGMLGVIWLLFFPNNTWMPSSVLGYSLILGAILVILFSFPSKNIIKTILMGTVGNLLGFLGTFSDTMSYIRLMAVGLASYYIASAFNNLGYQVGSSAGWLIPAGALIIILAHALNIFLGIIAIFAHGVRLNMLEFSNNAGVQWVGYAYDPFTRNSDQGVE